MRRSESTKQGQTQCTAFCVFPQTVIYCLTKSSTEFGISMRPGFGFLKDCRAIRGQAQESLLSDADGSGTHTRKQPPQQIASSLYLVNAPESFSYGKQLKKLALRDWYESHLPIGVHPFRAVWTYERLLHVSCLALATFSAAAAGRHSLIWIISRFVKPPSKKSKLESKSAKSGTSNESEDHIASSLSIANGVSFSITSHQTPAIPLAGTSDGHEGENGENVNELDAVSRLLLLFFPRVALILNEFLFAYRPKDSDSRISATIAVSQLCYKQRRITVPPAVVFAANGFHAAPDAASKGLDKVPRTGMAVAVSSPSWYCSRVLV
ncbi:hypothetical protein B0H19DRAFT_1071303 [Mycena capillaripes]|nr:hypothetical protein B0H19DRAFT_1071303 [Mycena capillaripes]